MPTYEYACDACGHGFEREQRITEDPIKKCPKCGKAKARRMVGGAGFILKGGGWYSDLYSGPSNKKSEPPKSDSSGGGSSSGASSSPSTDKGTTDKGGSKSKTKAAAK
jgi:putative FmdB family regulatory protein